jgi:hypothetical protein
METLLSLTNKVLVRLREDEVTSTAASPYATLIAQFVTQAVDEVEDATDWIQLRDTILLPAVVDVFSYSLTGAGTGFRILQVYEDTQDYELSKAPSFRWMNKMLLQASPAKDAPTKYDVNGMDSNGDALINLYPIPNASYSVNVNAVIKSHLVEDTDTTPVPYLPVLLRAYLLAVDERGDDDGASMQVMFDGYVQALATAVQIDASRYEDETVWYED